MKTRIRIWWAHRECWNASACSVPSQCKQPAHVCACLPPLKLLSISLWCPFLLIQTFVPPATTDEIPPQDFIHKHSIRIAARLQRAPLTVQLSWPLRCKECRRGFRQILHSYKKVHQIHAVCCHASGSHFQIFQTTKVFIIHRLLLFFLQAFFCFNLTVSESSCLMLLAYKSC